MDRKAQLKKLYLNKIVGGLLEEYVADKKAVDEPLDKAEFRAFVAAKTPDQFEDEDVDAIFERKGGRQIDLPLALCKSADELELSNGGDPAKLAWVGEYVHGGMEIEEGAVKVPKDGYYQVKASASFYQMPLEGSAWISPVMCLSVGGEVKAEDRASGNWLTAGVEKEAHEDAFSLSALEYFKAGEDVAVYVANDGAQGRSIMKLSGNAKLSVFNVKSSEVSY